MKKSWLFFVFSILLLNFISAYNGYYGGFSLSDLLSEIDSDTMVLGATLIISFAILSMALQRVFKDNKPVSSIVAFVLALLITWGVNEKGYDFESFFYDIGLGGSFLEALLPLIILGGFIFAIIKWRGTGLYYIGAFLILGMFVVEEQGIMFILAIFSFLGGIAINHFFPNKKQNQAS